MNNHTIKTIKSDFEVVALPNLSNTSAVEMVFWAQPTGAVGPLCRGPRGRADLFQYSRAAIGLPRTLLRVPTHGALLADRQSPQPFHSRPRLVPWSHPGIKTSWVRVRRGERSCLYIICSWLLLLQTSDQRINKLNSGGIFNLVPDLHFKWFNYKGIFFSFVLDLPLTSVGCVISFVPVRRVLTHADCPFHSQRAACRTVFQLGWHPV